MATEQTAAKSDLPQLNPDIIGGQVFWALLIFGCLYYVVSKIALPKLVSVLEHREERISTDLRKAKELQKEASYLDAKFRQHQEASKIEAREIMSQAREEISAMLAANHQERLANDNAKIAAAEQNIAEMRAESLKEVERMIASIAGDAYQRISGKSVSPSVVANTVQRVLH